ncbi:putative ribonuclease H-like domain-containing protein, partial [Tanacetum coccineum]
SLQKDDDDEISNLVDLHMGMLGDGWKWQDLQSFLWWIIIKLKEFDLLKWDQQVVLELVKKNLFLLKDIDQDSAHMVVASEVPMLKSGEYEIWRMRIEQYIQMIDYALWEVKRNRKGPNYALMAFSSSSPNSELIECQIIDNCKKGLGYENYNAVPPPYIGNFMPSTPDLSFTGLDEFVNKPIVENCKAMSSEEEPKVVRKYNDALSIEEWVSDIIEAIQMEFYRIKELNASGCSDPKSSHDDGSKPLSDDGKKVDEDPRKDSECKDQEKEDNVNNTNNINTVSSIVNVDGTNEVNTVVADMNNLDTTIDVKEFGGAWEEPKKLQEVCTLVDLPNGKRAIGTKWVFRNKNDERGIVIRNKARLVTQGYTQEEGIDYDKVFAPVARIKAIKLFLAYDSFKIFMVYQMDVKSAFINGKIKEEVYVCQPPGFEDPDFPDRVYKVKKSLYGLHQAPRAWYETLSTYLLDNEFQRGKIDKTLFIKRYKGNILMVQVYVDDIIFGSTKKELCNAFEKLMHEKFQMISMGELTFFLRLQVQQKKDDIFISQDKYVGDILKKFSFTEVKTASTPIETQKPLLKDEDDEKVDVHMYRSMIGSLMYLTSSRPDIMYLKSQPKLGLWYPKDSPFDLVAYTDSNYAGASLDRKSTTGGCQFLGSRLISWQCKKQTVVEKSTTEAEYVAASSCCRQVLWIQNQLLDYRRDLQLEDAKGVDCLPNATIIKQLTLMGSKTTAWNEFSSTMASAIICLATNQKFNFSKYIFESMVKNLENVGKYLMYPRPKRKDTEVTQPSGRATNVADEAVNEEMDDSLVRAATTASSLEVEQDSGNINKTQSKATPNEPSSPGTSSGGGPRRQETMGDTMSQTRSENVSKLSNDPLLARGNTLRSGEDSQKLQELMELCTTLQSRVLNLKTTKTTQANEIAKSSRDEESLGEDASKQERRITDIDDDEDITLVNDQVDADAEMFDVDTLTGDEVLAEKIVAAKDVNLSVDEVTLAQALAAFKSAKV